MITTEIATGILEHKLWEPLVTGSREYLQIHGIVRKTYGLATKYLCENCDQQADEFAWNHECDPRLVTSYDPLCYSCHHKYDGIHDKFIGNAYGVGCYHPHETRAKGETQGLHKLTEAEVLEIRAMYASGKYSQYDLAEMYGVCQRTIHLVVNRDTWNHI